MRLYQRLDCLVYLFVCLFAFPGYIAASEAKAQMVSPPSEIDPQADNPYIRDERVTDAFVPVVTLEQLGDSQNNLQGYRIQIFKNGRSIYHGFREVRTVGEVRFSISPEQVQKIQTEFLKYKFWQVPEDQYGLPRGLGNQALLFILREGNNTRAVRLSGSDYALVLLGVVEDQVTSKRWRCPYIDTRGDEKCGRLDGAVQEAKQRFLRREYQQLMDTYK